MPLAAAPPSLRPPCRWRDPSSPAPRDLSRGQPRLRVRSAPDFPPERGRPTRGPPLGGDFVSPIASRNRRIAALSLVLAAALSVPLSAALYGPRSRELRDGTGGALAPGF